MQLVCDARCKIIDALAKFSGICHDLFKLSQEYIDLKKIVKFKETD